MLAAWRRSMLADKQTKVAMIYKGLDHAHNDGRDR
jgi:hypothetical protein